MHRFVPLFTMFALATFATAQEATWLSDFAKAKAQAKAEKKDLLIDFTGSDWCGWCIKLDEEVFSQDAFRVEAPKHFVLVKLDFPRNKDLVTEDVRKQNEELGEKYQIQGYPTILLCDCEGRVYGATGYLEGGPDKYNTHLADLKSKGAAFTTAMAKADAGKGLDRAKALDEALSAIEAELLPAHHLAAMEEICTLDTDGKGGLKAKYEEQVKAGKKAAEERAAEAAVQKEAVVLQEAINGFMEQKEFDKALARLDETIKAPKNKLQHQIALFFKGMVIMDAKNDAKAAIVELEAAKALDEGSPIGKQIAMILPQLKKMAEQKKEETKEPGK
jgi:thioredoxin-related protein